MTRPWVRTITAAAIWTLASVLMAQQAPQPGPQPYIVGNRLGLPINPAASGSFNPISPNVKVFGAIYSAESCSYDPARNLIVVPNRGVGPNVQVNDAWVSLLNHDGSVHTARWIGVQNPGNQRTNSTPPLVLNEPFGSDIVNGVSTWPTAMAAPTRTTRASRSFAVSTCRPARRQARPAWRNQQDSTTSLSPPDGTVYATETGAFGQNPDPNSWLVWKITSAGEASILIQGAPLWQPNGIALDPQGNLVVVNIGNADVLTFSPDGKLLQTETAAQAGNDGLEIMKDGTKYVSSVVNGGVSRMRPKQKADLIAQNIPNAASMCYDAGADQLVIPMNANNALAFVPLK